MNSLDKLKEKHARELAEAQAKEALWPLLPLPPKLLCHHPKHFSARYDATSVAQVREIYLAYAKNSTCSILPIEAWRSGCLDTRPRPLNNNAETERSVHLFTAHAELQLHGFGDPREKYYHTREVSFWVRIGDRFVQVCIRVEFTPPDWLVSVRWLRDSDRWDVSFSPTLRADHVVLWGGQNLPGYMRSFYWEAADSFLGALAQAEGAK